MSLIKSHINTLLSLCFLFLSTNANGQFRKKKEVPEQAFGFLMNTRSASVSIPFKVYSNLVVVQAKLDERDSLNFIIDTGVSSIFITDPELAEELDFDYVREVSIAGAGEETELLAKVSVNHKFVLDEITGYQQNVVVLSRDILQLSEFMGIPIHGIFGHSLFESYVVSIDFNTMYLTVTKPDRFKLRRRHGTAYPIVVTQNKPYTDAFALVDQENGTQKPLRLVIDTGAGHALLLNSENSHIDLPEKTIRANLGRGLNGEIYGEIGRVSKISVGDVEVNDILASFPDSLSFSMKFPPTDANRQGSIGGEFLRRFKVTLNYQEGYMALKANKRKINQPFEHDMSGLDIRAYRDNLHRYYIKNITPDSPADKAGLQVDDEIVFFNSKNSSEISLTEIYNLLSKKEGKMIDIIYRRNGKLGVTAFELKRII
ncbi:aspartyl protease family protein [Jiulongibacter sediminis]|uniref:aspartyl protease family protein n=1 Tax=Jiulongibacter sediminis TaxID=1605367 RepID=UPI0026F2121A|nr:aspartyl protease family protein [Jiulongibacter sediminis]